MATTTNYGWTTPDDTALVKDGAAAIRTLGSSVDTTTKNLNPSTTLGDIEYRSSTANTNTRLGIGSSGQVLTVAAGVPSWANGFSNPLTTTGDTIYSSSGSTPARLGIGSTGQVLTVAAGVPSWAAPSAAGANWSLLNTGGTALTGATTITVSGISGKDKIMVLVDGASSVNTTTYFDFRFNTDSASNYYQYGIEQVAGSSYSASNLESGSGTYDSLQFARSSDVNTSTTFGYVQLSGCNSSGVKVFNSLGIGRPNGSNSQRAYLLGGFYNSSSTISSVSIRSTSGNFDAGTIFVYTSA